MKKSLFIIPAMTAALLASCSSEGDLTQNTLSPSEVAKTIGNSDVEIKLSSGSKGTRSSIESDEEGNFYAYNVGIFCLAKGNMNINPQELPIVWNPSSDEGRYSVWMNNVAADVNYNNVNWQDGQTRYYPTGNWHAYSFYGYYPRVEDYNISYNNYWNGTGGQVTANLTIDGTQDVIWGKGETDDTNGFSSYYFRQLDHATEVPSIDFSHKLMRLTFSTKAGADAYGSTESAKTMGVKKIEVLNVPTQLTLVIADSETPENEGTISSMWSEQDLVLESSDHCGGLDSTVWVQDDETTLGQGILIPVPQSNSTYYIRVTLENKNGELFASEYPMELRNNGTQFEAGKSYKVSMTINGPKTIELNAKLKAWEEDDTTIGEVTL